MFAGVERREVLRLHQDFAAVNMDKPKNAARAFCTADAFFCPCRVIPQVFENELRVYAEEGIDVSVSASVYTSSCLRMLTGKRDGVLPV